MTSLAIFIYILSVFVAAFGNILLKISARQEYDKLYKEYANRYFILGSLLFLPVIILSLYAFRVIPLSLGVILDSTAFIFIPILSRIILKERLSGRNMLGMALIVTGILIFQIH